jgi:hypothetical protein
VLSVDKSDADVGGYTVSDDENIMTSDTLSHGELALTGLESDKISIDNIVGTYISGTVNIRGSTRLKPLMSLLREDIAYVLYKFFVGSMTNNADRSDGFKLDAVISR